MASVILWGSSTPARSISYAGSPFCVISAVTLAGLNTVNLSEMNTFQQVILFVLIMVGSAIFVSIAVVYVMRNAFEQRFSSLADDTSRHQRGRPRANRKLTPSDNTR